MERTRGLPAQDWKILEDALGATARNILLTGVFGLSAGRATRDVDLAVAVEGWPQFEAIKVRLVGTGAEEMGSDSINSPRSLMACPGYWFSR
jgi:predicted nucleotidyltransferase